VTRVESAPFLRIDPTAIDARPWVDVATGRPVPATGMDGWDASVDLDLERHLRGDVRACRAGAGLGDAARIVCSATWHCPATTVRGFGSRIEMTTDSQDLVLSLHVPGRELAGSLDVRTLILLLEGDTDDPPLSARVPGSVLWEDSHRVPLEGQGSRFPMEWLDFGSAGWLPAGAGWYLEWSADEPSAPALGSIRLYLNESHAAIRAAVSARPPDPEQQVIRETMQFDVARMLVLGALRADPEAWDTAGEEPGTVATVVNRLIRVVFPTETLPGLRNRYAVAPDRLEVRMQDGLRLFRDLAPL
jgi:hypothetical protein